VLYTAGVWSEKHHFLDLGLSFSSTHTRPTPNEGGLFFSSLFKTMYNHQKKKDLGGQFGFASKTKSVFLCFHVIKNPHFKPSQISLLHVEDETRYSVHGGTRSPNQRALAFF
jgi:hypothetical protein